MRVILFAVLRELAEATWLEEQPAPTVGALLDRLGRRYGDRFSRIIGSGSVVVNGQAVGHDAALEPEDEVALLPPVSGG